MKKSAIPALILAACLLLPLCACGKSYRNDLTAAAAMDAVEAILPTGDYRTASDGYVSASMWGSEHQWLLDSVSDYEILLSENSDKNIDEIGIFHVKDKGNVQKVTAIVKEYVTAQQLRFKDLLASYNPDELPKTENGRVTVCGQYVLYTILSADATAKVHEEFEKFLEMAD